MTLTQIVSTLVAAGTVAAVPAAQAQPPAQRPAKGEFVSYVKAAGDTAGVKVRYQCNAGEALWVSVKQSADGRYDSRLEAWGSSEIAATWLQTHREGFTCDGKSRTTTFTVDALQPGSKGSLERGVAYVQFCLSQGDEDLVIYETGWVDVR